MHRGSSFKNANASPPSALRSPRSPRDNLTPRGSVRFPDAGGGAPLQGLHGSFLSVTSATGMGNSNKLSPSAVNRLSARIPVSSITPLKSASPTVGTIADRLNALHELVLKSDLAPLVKKACHLELFDADRVLNQFHSRQQPTPGRGVTGTTPRPAASPVPRTGAQAPAPQERAPGKTPSTARSITGGTASTTGSVPGLRGGIKASSNNLGAAGGGSFHADPALQSDAQSASEADPEAQRAAAELKTLRRQRQEKAWARFLKCISGQLSPDEVELLSLTTVKQLMKHYGIDRDPIDTANIELHWREIAQRREDSRNQKAIMHKTCAAASSPTKAKATRDLSASFDKRSDKRR
jgi:hypothetical protein